MVCPHCNQNAENEEFCPHCGKILPVSEAQSHYAVLGYDQEKLAVDLADLEKRLFGLSKKFHPDRFASKSPLEVQLSHDRSSAINNAYRTLKDPIARAKYMVEKNLGSIEEKSAHVPMDMADLFFEVQDALDVIKDADGNPPEDAVQQVRQAEKDLNEKVKGLEADLQAKFAEYDSNCNKQTLEQIKEILSERSYIKSFLRQVDSVMNKEE
jgi:molecular chaperone HscB